MVTVLLVNANDASASDLGSIFEGSGITKYAYKPASSTTPPTTWPTLQTLISANTRLMTFVASLADNTAAPYLMDEFTYIFENNFDVTSASNFTCTPDRPSTVSGNTDAALASNRLPFMNHFLDEQQIFGIQIPNVDAVATTNSASTTVTGALGGAAQTCSTQYGRQPAFVLVDFFDQGPAIATVDSLNGVSNPVGRTKTPVVPAESSTTNAAVKMRSVMAGGNKAVFGLIAVAAYMVMVM